MSLILTKESQHDKTDRDVFTRVHVRNGSRGLMVSEDLVKGRWYFLVFKEKCLAYSIGTLINKGERSRTDG